ncbi:hypothetical protein OHB44_33060 (plasmid) [Micromonospora sp. NBC_00821]|uniref:hypothetical protein n=1 Tax=Micromonospora sp. NBC_00821 TaxID=2975977 RepID=UPI002ED363F9|nr:hypothetical protein OHB44_33060 [Micromonospora sp. NBC_00821]
MTDQSHYLVANPQQYFEALGRVMSSLRDTGALNGATNLDWWQGAGGRTWEIEWQGGPFPTEVAARLLGVPEYGADEGATETAVQDLIAVRPGNAGSVHLVVLDVPVNLRAIDPIGASRVWLDARAVTTGR